MLKKENIDKKMSKVSGQKWQSDSIMEGVQRRKQFITQPIEDGESVAGLDPNSPYTSNAVSLPSVNGEADISIRKTTLREPLFNGKDASLHRHPSVVNDASTASMLSDDGMGLGVDIRRLQLQPNLKVRQPQATVEDLSINVRKLERRCRIADDLHDLCISEESWPSLKKPAGYVTYGEEADVLNLLKEKPAERGVICNDKVLHIEHGLYTEGEHYSIIPDTQSKGAYGEAAMCQDLKTGKPFIVKKVRGRLCENEVKVPLLFKDLIGVPEVYGVIFQNGETEIFQEFAGLSMRKLIDSDYAQKLRDPNMVLLLAFQAFATIDKFHSQGVTHQDIKPENLCVDVNEKSWRLKVIDFGTSQMPGDQVTEGLTYEYLSPESCRTVVQAAFRKIPKESARLGPKNDVWAMALSLLYCLCGYHVMIYISTGDTVYRDTDPQALNLKRMECLKAICSLTDDDIVSKLIHAGWPSALRTVLYHTLRVNPAERWTAKQAAGFILAALSGSALTAEPRSAQPGFCAGFTGLSPARLVVRPQPAAPVEDKVVEDTEDKEEAELEHLPMFNALLPDDLSKKAPRPYKKRVQRDCPYEQCARRTGSKVIKF